MEDRDRRAIEDLFQKLRVVESRSAPRDPEAERYIRAQLSAQPSAAYYMAQTIIVQEQALAAAQRQIEQSEEQGAGRARERGPFSGIFGRDGSRRDAGYSEAPRPGMRARPWGAAAGRGGGFLAGAAQTAMGVAGGVLLGNMVADMFDIGEPEGNEVADSSADDASGWDSADAGDAGGDIGGDFGDFDLG